jgi:hypothetical protein
MLSDHEVQQLGTRRFTSSLACYPAQRQRNVAEHGAGSQQVKVLEDHANLTTRFGEFFLTGR